MLAAFNGMGTDPENFPIPAPLRLLATTVPPFGWIVAPGPTFIVVPDWIVPDVICEAVIVVLIGTTLLQAGVFVLSSVKILPGAVGA